MKNRNLALLALTGILTLAACSTGPTTPTNPGPTNPGPTDPGPTNPGPTNPGPTNPIPSGITITSPTIGSTLTENTVVVNFTTVGALTDVQCGVQGGTFTPASNVGAGSGSCAVDLTNVANGPVTLVVQGKNTAGQTVSSSVAVNLAKPVVKTSTPSFGPEMVIGADGRIDYQQYLNGGTRLLVQNNPGNNDGSDEIAIRYVKGTVTVSFSQPAGGTRVEAWVSGTIDGAKTGALYNIYDGAPSGTATFDTTTLNGVQSKVLYLVTRSYVGGQQFTTSLPFVVDNTGPQAADGDFEGASGTGNRLLRDFGAPNNNWAKGKVELFTTNTNLIDQVFNPASGQTLPAGVDSISYFFVPIAQLNRVTTVTGQSRVSTIREVARTALTRTAESAGTSRDYRTTVDSTGGQNDGRYAVFTITTDQMGNQSASNSYDNLAFDNIGPSAQNVTLRDTSPLPFPSADPSKYISDFFTISGSITDSGVGLAGIQNAALNFCGRTVSLNIPGVIFTTGTITLNSTVLDSNIVAPSDGECIVTFSGPDALGNIGATAGSQTVIFDNTDPSVNIQRPTEGQQVVAGTTVNLDATISDITSGINPTFTKTFWNDYLGIQILQGGDPLKPNGDAIDNRVRPEFIAAPVEFRTDPLNSNSAGTPISLTGGWLARYPGLSATTPPITGTRGMELHALVVDKAGNASVQNRRVNVTQPTIVATPNIGPFDVYERSTAPAYQFPGFNDASHLIGFAGNLFDLTKDFNVDVSVPGTVSRAGGTLASVEAHRQLELASWNDIVAWQLANDPTLTVRPNSDQNFRRSAFAQLTPFPGGQREPTAPWFLIGDNVTSSNLHRTTTALRGENAFAGVSAIAALVTDSTGQYSATAELQNASTIQNTTPANANDVFQFVVTNAATSNLNPVYAGTPAPGQYALQGSTGNGSFTTLSSAQVTYVADSGTALTPGVNNLQAFYTQAAAPAPQYTQFRLVLNDGFLRIGQTFNR